MPKKVGPWRDNQNVTRASFGSWNLGVWLMKWTRCGVSKFIRGEVIDKTLSRGASIRATRYSKYSLAPLNRKLKKSGRVVRMIGGGRRLFLPGGERKYRIGIQGKGC